jgi:DNA-binding transcriptional MerR regulator
MSKAQEAFRTISEVAEELGVPKHVLRFWEVKFPQVRPMKRGGGRRYYRPEDLDLLRGIRHLLHAEAYTIKGVQKILREQGIDAVKDIARAAAAATAEKEVGRGKRRRGAETAAGPVAAAPAPAQPATPAAEAAAATTPVAARGGDTAPARASGAAAPGSSGRGAARGRAGRATREIVEAAIAELQACRSMLLGEEPAPAARQPARRTRAGRS